MYDSTNMDAIPLDAQIVAGYPHAFPTDYARFPHALQVKIDQHGNHADDCHVVDVEFGALIIAGALSWVRAWHQLHPSGLAAVNGHFNRPTVYASLNTWNSGLRAVLAGQLYDAWIAEWGTGPTVLPGSSAHQYENTPGWDKSVVYDPAWGVSMPAPPTPVPPWQAQALAQAQEIQADAAALVTLLEAHQ